MLLTRVLKCTLRPLRVRTHTHESYHLIRDAHWESLPVTAAGVDRKLRGLKGGFKKVCRTFTLGLGLRAFSPEQTKAPEFQSAGASAQGLHHSCSQWQQAPGTAAKPRARSAECGCSACAT